MRLVYISIMTALTAVSTTDLHAADSTLSVTCRNSDVGAEVFVDGRFKGECPVDVLVHEGKSKLVVQNKANTPAERIFEQEVRVGDGVVKTIEVILGVPLSNSKNKLQEVGQSNMGSVNDKRGSLLSVICGIDDIDSEVLVDDKPRGVCPINVQVNEGTVKLRVQKKVNAFSDRIFEQEIRVGDGVIKKVMVQLGVARLNAAGKQHKPEQSEVKQGAFKDCTDCPEMTVIPAGSFDMGSPDNEIGHGLDEGPVHRVAVAPFAMGVYEVTRAQYAIFVGETKYDAGTCWAVNEGGGVEDRAGRNSSEFMFRKDSSYSQFDTRPVSCVNWLDAQAYIQWLSNKIGKNYRLPTEAEWEYAARANTSTPYYWGNDVGHSNANCSNCSTKWDGSLTPWEGAQSSPVGSFKPNAFGLYDMLGNVWEWTEDTYHANYKGAPIDGSAWIQKISGNDRPVGRVIRGGSWKYSSHFMRAAYRMGNEEIKRYEHKVGFRLVRALP